MRKNLYITWVRLRCLVFFFSATPVFLYSQDGTLNDGFSVQLLLPGGQKPVYAVGNGGYGYATFGGEITGELELDVAWARTAAGDSICCTPAVNTSEITGKAALVRRGDCNFQLKAGNAEAAGAAAVIVVNNAAPTSGDEFAVTNMIPTSGVAGVTVPCIFVCRVVGDQITAALDAGLPVKIRYVFPHLGEGVAAYHFATPVSQVRPLGAIGVNMYNRTGGFENGIVVKADIIEPDGNVVSFTENAPGLGAGLFSFVQFPEYTPPAVKGRFDVVFSVNKYRESYDTVRASFIITEHSFATDDYQLLPNGAGPSDADFATAGYYYETGGLCITGSQGATVTHATLGIANAAEVAVPGNPSANPIYVFLLDADFNEDGQVDDFVNFLDLNLLSFGSYEIQGTELPNQLIHVPLFDFFTGEPFIQLLPDHLYYIALAYNGSDALTARSIRFSASGKVDYLPFPTNPLIVGQLFTGGWSDATVVQRLQVQGFIPDDPYPLAPPLAAFDPAANHLSVTFTNNSANATSYAWDFGDGATSTESNPVHDYAADGVYTVKLVATNAEGSHAAVRTIRVGTVPPVSADFSLAQTTGCAPYLAQFAAAAQGAGLSYVWSFPGGDPLFSTDQNPAVTYASPGTYTVSLVVSDGASTAAEEKSAYVTVLTAPLAIFSAADPVGKTVSFENLSYYATSYAWDFGDGFTSTEFQPSHTYAAEGTYTVTLTATNACDKHIASQTVTIALPPAAQFTASTNGFCAPVTVQFTDMSSANVTSWNWSFPGGTPAASTEQNPVVVYDSAGNYDATLMVTSLGGADTLIQNGVVTVLGPPVTGFTLNVDGITVSLLNNTTGATSYAWNFGDGRTSIEVNPVVNYHIDGVYTITLTATNACGTEMYLQTITIAQPPMAAFSPLEPSGCAPFSVVYFSSSSSNVTAFNWSFPGGMPATSTESNPTVTYTQAGLYGATLIVTSLGGSDTLTQTGVISIFAGLPVADFNAASLDGLAIYFQNLSQNAMTYFWEFGDSTTSTEVYPAHEYAAQGTYTVTLTLQNPCGQAQITKQVQVEVGTKMPRLDETQVRISPNPASDIFRVEVDLKAVSARVRLRLLDAGGRLLLVQQQEAIRQGTFLLPVSHLPAGAYQVWIETEEGVALRKVQVLR